MVKRKKRRKTRRKISILLVLFIFVVIIAITFYQSQRQTMPKKPAKEYFEILEPGVDDGEFHQNGTALIIYAIHFKLKAIGGDAHGVIVQSWAKAEPEELGTILKGEVKYVSQISPRPFGLFVKEKDGKFPMTIRITSTEAEGEITIYF